MPADHLGLFLAVVALGAWLQTVTGFALALTVLGAVTQLQLAPLPLTAIVVSLLGLASSLVALAGHHRAIRWRLLLPILAGMLPTVTLGVWLLGHLQADGTDTLRRILGLFILGGGVLLLLSPRTRPRPAAARTGVLAGLLGGLFGGLFAAPTPPVVFHLYREPAAIEGVRATLFAVIIGGVTLRMSSVAGLTGVSPEVLRVVLFALPATLAGSLLGRVLSPRLSERVQRRVALLLLTLLGLPLAFG
ncbi:MAG TPA: TSUP family transporter [Gammaproteobacteria bacterium]